MKNKYLLTFIISSHLFFSCALLAQQRAITPSSPTGCNIGKVEFVVEESLDDSVYHWQSSPIVTQDWTDIATTTTNTYNVENLEAPGKLYRAIITKVDRGRDTSATADFVVAVLPEDLTFTGDTKKCQGIKTKIEVNKKAKQ
jgi:hypothetical protein